MRARAAGLLTAIAALAAAAPSHAATTVTLSGQPIVQSLVADLVYFYRHEVPTAPQFALSGGGTGAGIADAVRGITNGAMVSRDLEPDDPPGLVLTKLATSAVCLATNRQNPVPEITRATLQDIVAGRATDWSQIPGSTRTDAIMPVALSPGTGSTSVFEEVFVDPETPFDWHPTNLLISAQARDFVEARPAAFAYLDLALTGPLHVIPYEGVPCTRKTVANRTYPARKPLGIATVGKPKGALKRFLRWARTSKTARRVIKTRYVPVT